ncbi:MAG: YdcF family protein [Erysipelotrichaceae bacterium]|nr:YdcF family protein [Erysipelotrichaceae bacterium]
MEIIGYISVIMFALPYFFGRILNYGNILGLIFGVLAAFSKKKTFLRSLLWLILVAFVAASGVIWAGGAETLTEPKTAVILGCGVDGTEPSKALEQRLEAGLDYLKDNDVKVILTGGMGDDENISEAECMYQWLKERGIDESRMIKEDKSTSTYENMLFSGQIMEEQGMDKDVVIITNRFHEMRANILGENQGFSCESLPAKTTWWLIPTYYVREVIAFLSEYYLGHI